MMKKLRDILWLYKVQYKNGKVFVILSFLFWIFLIPLSRFINVLLPKTIILFLENHVPFSQIVIFVVCMQLLLLAQPVYENIFNLYCKNRMLPTIAFKLNRQIYDKAIKTDYKYTDNPSYYDSFGWSINHYAKKAAEAQNLIHRISSSIITIISMLAIIATLSPIAIIVVVVSGVVENLLHIRTNYFDVKKDQEIIPFDRKLEYFHKIFYGKNYASDLKSTNLKKFLFEAQDKAQTEKIGIIKKFASKMFYWSIGATITFYVSRTFVILNIAYGIYSNNIVSVGSYVALMLAVDRLTDTMNDLFYYVKNMNSLGLYATKIRTFFNLKSEIETDDIADQQTFEHTLGPMEVTFKDVSFHYDNSSFSISDFSLTINAGEKIAIVGENGVGKSTLVKLLLRLYDVNKGEILINGINLKEYNKNDLRSRIGVAFQNPNIYSLSFSDNIELYNPSKEDERENILQKLHLDKVLEKCNADFTTELTREFNEKGIILSGGEAQKVAIARLLTREFGLLLFDEPSSALDPIAEYELSNLILDSSNRSTTIIIAHRLSTIRNVDRIVVVDNGMIKEIGNHDELIRFKGKYFEMFTKQAENYIQ